MTQPTSVPKMMKEQDDITEIKLSVPILKEVARQLHLAVAHHRRIVLRGKKNKKKHDFNFRHNIHKDGRQEDRAHLTIYKWIQDQGKYSTKALCYVFYHKDTLIMEECWSWWDGGDRAKEALCKTEIANPECFDLLSEKLIELLDWRG